MTGARDAVTRGGNPAAIGGGNPAAIGGGDPAGIPPGGTAPIIGGGDPAVIDPGGTAPVIGGGNPAAIAPGGNPAAIAPGGNPAAIGAGNPVIIGGGNPAAIGAGNPAVIGGGNPAVIGGGNPAAIAPGGNPAGIDPGGAAPVSGWEHRRAGWLVVALTVLVFAPTLVFERVAFDDPWLWSDDSPLRTPSTETLRHVWLELDARARHDVGTEYLPVRDVVVAADMAVWKDNLHGFHATQLLLYAVTVLALGGLLVRFGMRRDLAWLATLLWAIHPIHVESVAWLSERKGILAGLLVVACGHAWIRYRRGGGRGWVALAAVAAVAATWSKAPAMFAPAVFAAWDLLLLPAARRRWIAIGLVGAATALAAVPVILVARDAGVVDNQFEAAPDGRLALALGAQGHYVESLVLARTPSLSYPIQSEGAAPLDLVLGAAAVLGSLALAASRRRVVGPAEPVRSTHADRRAGQAWRLALLAWAWIWFLPISHLLTSVHIAVADRFAYLWSLGGCAAAAWLVLRTRGTTRLAITGAIICILGISTLRAQAAWTSSLELFANGFASAPDDPVACERLANERFALGQRTLAIAVLDRGLAVHPDHPYLLAQKARMLDATGQPAEALAAAERAARSGHASTMALHAELLARAGRAPEALVFAERAALRRPEDPAYARTRLELLIALRRFAEAEPVARELVARDPGAPSHLLLGRVLIGRNQLAEADLQLAIAAALGAPADAIVKLRALLPRVRGDRRAGAAAIETKRP